MTFNVAPVMPPLQQQLWDKTLDEPLAAGFVNFYEDANRTIPKVVYELTGTGPGSYTYVSLGSQLILSGIGTYVDSSNGNLQVYLWPYLGTPNDAVPSQTAQPYYVTVYSSTGVFQFDEPNWPPGIISGGNPSGNAFATTENIISNSQFVDVLFSSSATSSTPVVFTTTGTNTETPIAPDWSVITTGSGNFSVWQQPISDSTAPGNPAYALGFTSASYSQPIILRQRILAPRIFSGQYVSGTFIAQANDGGSYNLKMNYTPSITGTIQQICTGTTLSSGFVVIADALPVQIANPGSGTGYIDITIVIPVGAPVQISCIQLCGVAGDTETVAYLQETPEREVDHLFHYFQPQINYKPIPSYLTGWDFPLNPAQANGYAVATTANASSYTWDQTILFQSSVSMLSTSQSANGTMSITSADGAGATQAAIIQYLGGPQQIRSLLESDLSVNVFAFSPSPNIKGTVSLWYTTNGSLPAINSGNSLVVTLDANGHPSSVVAGWTEIPFPTNSGKAQFTFNTTMDTDIGFSYWPSQIGTAIPNTATFFAIVVGTSAIPHLSSVVFNSVSLVPGKIPTRPAPQTPDEVLRECEYYYESSYNSGIVPGTASSVSSDLIAYQNITNTGGSSWGVLPTSFGFTYRGVKRSINPTVTLYSPVSGASANVYGVIYTGGTAGTSADVSVGWVQLSKGAKSINYAPASGTPLTGVSGTNSTSAIIEYHYTVDARLGVV